MENNRETKKKHAKYYITSRHTKQRGIYRARLNILEGRKQTETANTHTHRRAEEQSEIVDFYLRLIFYISSHAHKRTHSLSQNRLQIVLTHKMEMRELK